MVLFFILDWAGLFEKCCRHGYVLSADLKTNIFVRQISSVNTWFAPENQAVCIIYFLFCLEDKIKQWACVYGRFFFTLESQYYTAVLGKLFTSKVNKLHFNAAFCDQNQKVKTFVSIFTNKVVLLFTYRFLSFGCHRFISSPNEEMENHCKIYWCLAENVLLKALK